MTYLLRLDLERIRLNLANTTTSLVEDDDLLRKLSARGVWRYNDQWCGATRGGDTEFRGGEDHRTAAGGRRRTGRVV